MKLRKGFVSNSSSSSFLIGLAKISDLNRFYAYVKKNDIKLDAYDKFVRSYSDILSNVPYFMNTGAETLTIESFMSDISMNTKEINGDDHILVISFDGNDGDSSFYDDDSCGLYYDIDYNIDIDFFDNNEQKIYNMLHDKDSGIDITTANVTYGAGRNG